MKKFLTMLFVVAMVTALFCGVTVFAAEGDVTATVVADEGWENATFNPTTGVLTDVDAGYSFVISGTTISHNGVALTGKVVIPSSFTYSNGEEDVTVGIKTVKNGILAGVNHSNSNGTSTDTVTEVVVSEGITVIDDYAFQASTSLVKVTLPDGITGIGRYAFGKCSALSDIALPSTVKGTIEEGAFYGTAITEIVVPEGVTKFESKVFYGCKSLASVTLPGVSLSEEMFKNCTSLTEITLPEGAKSMGKNCFNGCSALTTVSLPSTLTTFSGNATSNSTQFSGCSKLTTINIPEGVPLLPKGMFTGCSSLESIVLPASLTTIGNEVFKQCYSLEKVVCKGNITTIGADAFRMTAKLTSVVFEGNTETAPTLTSSGNGCPINSDSKNPFSVTVYYPASAAAAFEDSEYAAQWTGNYATITLARIPGEEVEGGCSISAVVAAGADTTVTYSAVDADNNATVVVIVALYAGDEMLAAKVVSMDEATATFTGVTGATKARIFMWDSLANAKPLYESFEY